MQVRANENQVKDDDKYPIWQKKSSGNTERSEPQTASIVTYTEEETEAFKNDMEVKNHKNTKKSTATVVCRFRCWYEGEHPKELELNKITKQEAPVAIKTFHFRNSTDE